VKKITRAISEGKEGGLSLCTLVELGHPVVRELQHLENDQKAKNKYIYHNILCFVGKVKSLYIVLKINWADLIGQPLLILINCF